MSPKVLVRDLRKSYGATLAVRGVNFEIHEGEIFGLLGPNGAGKTTTTECIVGLRHPDAGSIEICGIDTRRNPKSASQKIGAALQTTSLQDKITPREALTAFGRLYNQHTPAPVLLDRFNLSHRAGAAFDTLSGGERQRLALALAFVNNSEVIFLDEPTAGLDPQSRRELRAEILRMKNDRFTVMLTTHDMEEAEQLCDRLAIIHNGTIVATGTPRELIDASDATTEIIVTTAQHPHTRRLRTATPTKTLAELTAGLHAQGIEITDLKLRKATLEDVFLRLTGNAE